MNMPAEILKSVIQAIGTWILFQIFISKKNSITRTQRWRSEVNQEQRWGVPSRLLMRGHYEGALGHSPIWSHPKFKSLEAAFTGAPGKILGGFFLLSNAIHGPLHLASIFTMWGGLAQQPAVSSLCNVILPSCVALQSHGWCRAEYGLQPKLEPCCSTFWTQV